MKPPVRQSAATKRALLQKDLDSVLSGGKQDDFAIQHIDEIKGRGVLTLRDISDGRWLVVYDGVLFQQISELDFRPFSPDSRNESLDLSSCYLMFFKYNSKRYVMDASEELKSNLGRFVNHRKFPNCKPVVVAHEGKPKVLLRSIKDIPAGSELLYDYGVRDRATIVRCPWISES